MIDLNIPYPPVIAQVFSLANTFSAGQLVKVSGTNAFDLAIADSLPNSRCVALVGRAGVGEFRLVFQGYVHDDAFTGAVPSYPAGTLLYLSSTVAGGWTDTEPTDNSNPLAVILESGVSMIFSCNLQQYLAGGGGAVDSVNGQTGVVVLDAEDVGAWPLAGTGTDLANGTIEVDPTFTDPLLLSDDGTNENNIFVTPSSFRTEFSGASINSVLDIGLNGFQVQIGLGGNTSRFQAEGNSTVMSVGGGGGSASFIVEVNADTDAATYPFINIINRRRCNFDAVATPTVNDDGTRGYANRSFWIYDGRFFICTSPTTGAAVWVEVGAGGSGTVNSGTLNRLTYYAATGTAVSELAAITASRALKSDANGLPVAFDTATEPSLTELSYVKGVTSAIQTQLNGKEATITVLPISKGGTNSGTALSNNRVMQSSGGAIVEATAITPARALKSDANGIPVHFDTATEPTLTELSYVKGVTSAIQAQINTINIDQMNGQYGSTTPTVPAAGTRYAALQGRENIATSEVGARLTMRGSGTFRGIYLETNNAQTVTGALTVTLRKNGADTALTFAIAAGSAAGIYSDTANTVTFVDGDTFNFKIDNAAPALVSAQILNTSVMYTR